MYYTYLAMKNYILPFRDLVVSPGLTVPVLVDNHMSVNCIKTAADAGHQQLILVPQHSWAYPSSVDDIYTIGTIGDVVQVLSMPDGAIHLLVRTTDAVAIKDIEINDGVFTGVAEPIKIADDMDADQTLLLRDLLADNMQTLAMSTRKFKMEKLRNVIEHYPLPAFVDAVIQTADVDTDTAVKILAAGSWTEKLTILLEGVKLMLETIKIEESINKRIHQQMENGRRDAILQEKMRALRDGDADAAVAGHAGVALSVAEGMAAARDRRGGAEHVVAVVGAGHVAGMQRYFDTEIDTAELDQLPKPSIFWKVAKWIIPAILVGGIAYGVSHKGFDSLYDLLVAWILPNSVFCFIAAIAALAHPITILCAIIVSPITSTTPVIGAGIVLGLLEAWLRKPTVADCEDIQNIHTLKGFYKNAFTHILVVCLLTTIGSALGAYVGIGWLVSIIGFD